ncbi:MAG: type III-A CRISPR-associated RAMP protein Csm3 [Epsilonproteobacteria bacterium]|nr:type III-A CRISPR-associated RAMP protein Csm3 [Campylobacterota bacterium]MBD3807218.1 type III-A CRISPR-associated RAMP protein Csm3 [Campylobacterota bacterium]
MITIDSKLILVTGLHIGGADDGMKIGGVDSPVMKREVFCDENSGEVGFGYKRKITEPYIAGSSLKGKIRTLLEHYFRLIDPLGKGSVVDSKSSFGEVKYRNLIIKLFGESAGNDGIKGEINITRTVFRDCFITQEVRKAALDGKIKLTEEKYENVIDRKTGTTIGGGLRQIERVPSAVEFDFNMSIRAFEGDNTELFSNTLLLGLKLLELDALGGSGSRGYGRVRFDGLKIDDKLIELNESIKELDEKIKNEINKG